MTVSNKKHQVYPGEAVTDLLGEGAALNWHLIAWYDVLRRAVSDNEDHFDRNQWYHLGSCLRAHPNGHGLSRLVLDCYELEGFGEPEEVSTLIHKLDALDPAHAWALVFVIRRRWNAYDLIDLHNDEWWRLQFVLDLAQAEA